MYLKGLFLRRGEENGFEGRQRMGRGKEVTTMPYYTVSQKNGPTLKRYSSKL